jgi:hypothetical protein
MSLVALALLVLPALPAAAESLDNYLEANAAAEFSGEQVVSCETPDGQRTVAVQISQVDGVTTATDIVAGSRKVQAAGGTLAIAGSNGVASTSAALAGAVPKDHYEVTKVVAVAAMGRSAQRITVVDSDGLTRATMTFDLDTGAMLSAQIRSADGTIYCSIRMVEFSDQVPESDRIDAGQVRELEAVAPVDDARMPDGVGGFTMLESYRWDDGGVVAFYSDGLFSFTLLATDRPVILDADDVGTVDSNGGTYVRWYGAGQVMYVWESAQGGVTVYGDLPPDLQEEVLDGLPHPRNVSVMTRWWRNLFG